MVRMSDLVRGPGAAPPPTVEEEPKREAPAPIVSVAAVSPAAVAPPPRLTLRSIDVTASSAPVAPPPAVSPRPSTETARGIFDELHAFLAGVRERITSGGAASWDDVHRLIERVVLSLEDSAELFWLANSPAVPAGIDYLVAHQTRVAILGARIGLNVGYDRARAVSLGMAGALIDIGLWQSPDGLLRRLDNLTAEEQAVYQAHPQRGAAQLTQWSAPASLIQAVLQHHEREQGQGFPQGLTGSAICQDAKILGLIDAYTGLTLPASRRPGLRPHEAIRAIVRSKHESFSPALIKALLSEISVFPPGTLVRLNTGEVGQVTAVNRNHPLRPRVEVVSDSKGNRPLSPKTIDLSETPFLYITGPVSDTAK
jgi:HD-GYP domain-containing protein (c-di-GMP phosphodiesterase class II)